MNPNTRAPSQDSLHKALKEASHNRPISLDQLAEKIGLSPKYFSRIFNKEPIVKLDLFLAICNGLGVPASDVLRLAERFETGDNVSLSSGVLAEIDKAIVDRKKIEAYRAYRYACGATLAAARAFVDLREKELLNSAAAPLRQAEPHPPIFAKIPDADKIDWSDSRWNIDWTSIDKELLTGNMIPACKQVRSITGLGLREAVELIHARQARLRREGVLK